MLPSLWMNVWGHDNTVNFSELLYVNLRKEFGCESIIQIRRAMYMLMEQVCILYACTWAVNLYLISQWGHMVFPIFGARNIQLAIVIMAWTGNSLMCSGSKESPHEHLEWRISFVLMEKTILQSLSHSQFMCYGLLKLYLKEILGSFEEMSITYQVRDVN
jgi:hypothetical protein